MLDEADSDAAAERLERLGPECGRSLQIIMERAGASAFKDIVAKVARIADLHPIDARMILASASDLLSRLDDKGNRSKVPELITSDAPVYTSYKMFFLSQMATDIIATPKLIGRIFDVLIKSEGSEMEKAMLADNIFHAVLQVQRRSTAGASDEQQAEMERESLKRAAEAAEWPKGTGLFSVTEYPPLIFCREGSDAKTFSVGYAKTIIGNAGISRLLDDFKDPLIQVSAAWDLVRLDKYMTQIGLSPEKKDEIMQKVALRATSSQPAREQETERSVWLMATVAKITKSKEVVRAVYDLWNSIKKGSSMEVISRYFTSILSHETDPQRLSSMFSVLKESDNPEKAAFEIKECLETAPNSA